MVILIIIGIVIYIYIQSVKAQVETLKIQADESIKRSEEAIEKLKERKKMTEENFH